jgi:hypothetical protein
VTSSDLKPDTRLEAQAWAHTTPTCAALGHTFRVRTTDRALGTYLADVLTGLSVPGCNSPITTYSLVTTDAEPWPYSLHVDDERIGFSDDGAYILDYLLWHVNRQAIERTPHRVLLHAAGVERDGVCVILPAKMECGKTTLAAGLARTGFRYYTDEAVAIDPASLTVTPYAKPLSIDAGSWEVLPDLEPKVDEAVRPLLASQWQVPATSIDGCTLAEPAVPRLIISPQYRAGAVTELRPLSRAEMLLTLMDLTFDFRAQPARNLAVLGQVVAGSDCFSLTVGDLDIACSLIGDVVAGLADPTRSTR